MKITVSKQDLKSALQVVSNSMAKSGLDMSSHLVFRPLKDTPHTAEILSYSGRLHSSCPFPADVEVGDHVAPSFTLEGDRLRRWMGSVSDSLLTFEYDPTTRIVTALAPRGSQEFQSLNPDDFPFWDDLMDQVEVKAKIPAGRLRDALSYISKFVGDTSMENTSPQHCVTEARDGALLANDRKAGCLVKVVGLENAGFRLFISEIGATLKFLGILPSDDDVEVLEHSRGFMLRRGDGAVFASSKYQAAFPSMTLPLEGEDHFFWLLPKADLKTAIPFLMAGARTDDNRLYFSRPDPKGPVQVSMEAATGNRKALPITPIEYGQTVPDDQNLPEFMISVSCLQKVLDGWQSDSIKFQISQRHSSGYVRFLEDRDGDQYLTVTAWLKRK